MMLMQAGTASSSGPSSGASPGAVPTGTAPTDRSTEFQATTGGPEIQSGEVLLVQAYVAIWILLCAYLGILWRRSRTMHARLDAMDRVLDRAAAAKDAG